MTPANDSIWDIFLSYGDDPRVGRWAREVFGPCLRACLLDEAGIARIYDPHEAGECGWTTRRMSALHAAKILVVLWSARTRMHRETMNEIRDFQEREKQCGIMLEASRSRLIIPLRFGGPANPIEIDIPLDERFAAFTHLCRYDGDSPDQERFRSEMVRFCRHLAALLRIM